MERDTNHGDETMTNIKIDSIMHYSAAPDASEFQTADLARLNEIRDELNDPGTSRSARVTEWSQRAYDTDCEACMKAIALARSGKQIYVAQDDDGYYFATR
jgi:hypothetical protein